MHLPKNIMPKDAVIPPYPYGDALLFRQSNKGLYGGQRIQFGNNVSPDTETKSRRHWKPNIVTKGLYSPILKKRIRVRLTTRVLKTMDREGGLDNYLLKEGETRIKELGPLGWALRWRLMQTSEVRARFRAEAAALGLAQEIIDQQWPMPEKKKKTKAARLRARRERRAAELEAAAAAEAAAEDITPEQLGKQERQQKALRRQRTVRTLPRLTYSAAEKHQRLHYHRERIVKAKLGPVKDKKMVEKLAWHEMEKEREMYKVFGDKKTLVKFNHDMEKEFNKLRLKNALSDLEKKALNEKKKALAKNPSTSENQQQQQDEDNKKKIRESKGVLSQVLDNMSERKRAIALEKFKRKRMIQWLARYRATQRLEWTMRQKAKHAERRDSREDKVGSEQEQPPKRVIVEEEKDWAELAETQKLS